MGNGGKWKAQSKRQSTKLRVKVEKKVKEHARKLKKEKKKNPSKFKLKRKDPGIPADCPFKEQVLAEAEAVVAKNQEIKEKRRLELKEIRKNEKGRKLAEMRGMTLEGLASHAQRRDAQFDLKEGIQSAALERGLTDKSAKAYYKEFKKVVESADVILQVLDARDPLGSRCREVEQAVAADKGGKRLVLVLNKADLVPRDNLRAWVKYLRHEFPTIAFKASTQSGGKLGRAKMNINKTEGEITTSRCVGADTLMTLLGNYCRNKDVKTSIRVGVVGMPNVGKSSLINSLKRGKACSVGATPGVTKSVQEVSLDSKIKLLDSPGMVLASGNMSDASVALRNAIKIETLVDPITPVIAILSRVPRQHLMQQYTLGHFEDAAEFLALLARGQGKLKRGGVPDRDAAAKTVLNDWNSGKIKYFTHPPEEVEANISSEIVQEFAAEFSLEALAAAEESDMDTLPSVRPSETTGLAPSAIVESAKEIEDEEVPEEVMEESDDDDGTLPPTLVVPKFKKKKGKENDGDELWDNHKTDPLFKLEGNLRMKKAEKAREKKSKKERRRNDKVGMDLSHDMDAAFGSLAAEKSEDYSFDADFK